MVLRLLAPVKLENNPGFLSSKSRVYAGFTILRIATMPKPKTSPKKTTRHHKKPLCWLNKPHQSDNTPQSYERVACVFQGGGALGAYQVGAYKAILHHGYRPNYFAGVSIGAINSAIIVGNPPELQLEKLMSFWDTVSPRLWIDLWGLEQVEDIRHHWHNQIGAMQSIFHGLDGFFRPRPITPGLLSDDTPDKLSYYDTTPLRETLINLIDFDLINQKKVVLCLGAVNVVTGEMEYFSNERMEITVDHVMASAALPPGFPAIKIGDDYFWDGGIYANTPLVTVLDALPEQNTLCFVVDCFRLQGKLPHTMDQLEERQKDIRYASHSRRMTNVYTARQNLQAAIAYLGEKLSPAALKDPEVQKILQLGDTKRFSVVHIIFNSTDYAHSFKDYNFVRSAINYRLKRGFNDADQILSEPKWQKQTQAPLSCSIYGVDEAFFDQH